MYFNNDSARQQTGLSSRSLSQLILLLLTTLTGRESSPAACLPATFLGKEGGGRRETERKRNRESSLIVFLCSFSLGCVCVCTHTCVHAVLIVIFCGCVRFQVLACVVLCQPGRRCMSTVNVYSVHSEYTPAPCCLQRGFSASSRALSPSTLLRPQWLILTQAAVASNQHSQPRT